MPPRRGRRGEPIRILHLGGKKHIGAISKKRKRGVIVIPRRVEKEKKPGWSSAPEGGQESSIGDDELDLRGEGEYGFRRLSLKKGRDALIFREEKTLYLKHPSFLENQIVTWFEEGGWFH